VLEYLNARRALTDKLDQLSHSLLKIVPSADFRSFSFAFASDDVSAQVFAKDAYRVLGDFKELLANNTEAVFAGIRGQAYEAYVHRNFTKLAGVHDVTRLHLDGSVTDCKLTIPDLNTSNVFDDVKQVKTGEYGIPRSRTFAAVDAVIVPNVAPQMSVTERHGFKVDGLKAVKTGLQLGSAQALHVPIVCPPDVASQMKWQQLTRGKQRVKKPQGLVDGSGLYQYCLPFPWL